MDPTIAQMEVEGGEYKARDAAPKWIQDDDKRKKINLEIAEMLQASKNAIGDLQPRWDEVDAAEVNRPTESLKKPWPNAPWYHFPKVRPKIQAGTSMVAMPLTKADPFVIVRSGGQTGDRADAVERALHLQLARAEYPRHVRMALGVAQRRGKSVIRGTYVPLAKKNGRNVWPRIEMDVFSPEHLRQYPAQANSIEESILFGHVYTTTCMAVQRLQENGFYFDDRKAVGNFTADEWDQRLLQAKNDNSIKPEHDPLDCAELFMKFDDDEDQDWYQVQYDVMGEQTLRCVKYRYRTPWYKDFYLHEEYRRWLFENSRGSDTLPSQYYANDMRNLTTWLAMYLGIQPVFGPNGSLPDDVQQLAPGTFYPTAYGAQMWSPQGRVDLSVLPQLIQMADNDTDISSGLGSNAQALYRSTRPTAAEVNRVGQGQDSALSDDAMNAGFGLARFAEFAAGDLLYEHFEDWYPSYSSCLPKLRKEDFDRPYIFEPNASSVATPQEVFQEVSALLTALANVAKADPTFLARNPKLLDGLARGAVQSMDAIPDKDSLLAEEQDGLETALGAGASAITQFPGLGMANGAMGGQAPAVDAPVAGP